MTNLTRVEAGAHSALIDVTGYRVELDLAQGATTFESTSTVRFNCAEPGRSTFLDVKPQRLHRATLNDVEINLTDFDGERIALTGLALENEVVVSATMSYSNDGQGCTERSTRQTTGTTSTGTRSWTPRRGSSGASTNQTSRLRMTSA
jgi:aminopeptidase N